MEGGEEVTFYFSKGKPLKVSKAICYKSEVLTAMCCGNFSEAQDNRVSIPNIRRKIFLLLLELIQDKKDLVTKKCLSASSSSMTIKSCQRSARLLLAMRQYNVSLMATELFASLKNGIDRCGNDHVRGLAYESAVTWNNVSLRNSLSRSLVNATASKAFYRVLQECSLLSAFLLSSKEFLRNRFGDLLELLVEAKDWATLGHVMEKIISCFDEKEMDSMFYSWGVNKSIRVVHTAMKMCPNLEGILVKNRRFLESKYIDLVGYCTSKSIAKLSTSIVASLGEPFLLERFKRLLASSSQHGLWYIAVQDCPVLFGFLKSLSTSEFRGKYPTLIESALEVGDVKFIQKLSEMVKHRDAEHWIWPATDRFSTPQVYQTMEICEIFRDAALGHQPTVKKHFTNLTKISIEKANARLVQRISEAVVKHWGIPFLVTQLDCLRYFKNPTQTYQLLQMSDILSSAVLNDSKLVHSLYTEQMKICIEKLDSTWIRKWVIALGMGVPESDQHFRLACKTDKWEVINAFTGDQLLLSPKEYEILLEEHSGFPSLMASLIYQHELWHLCVEKEWINALVLLRNVCPKALVSACPVRLPGVVKEDTLLHLSARKGCVALTKWLLANGCVDIIDDENVYGRTPLHEASMHGWSVIVEILLDAGADPNIWDNAGYSAAAVAIPRKDPIESRELIHRRILAKTDLRKAVKEDPFLSSLASLFTFV